MARTCFLLNVASDLQESVARAVIRRGYELFVLDPVLSKALKSLELPHSLLERLSQVEDEVRLKAQDEVAGSLLLIAQRDETDAQNVAKLNLIRQLLSLHKNLAVFVNTSDLMSLLVEAEAEGERGGRRAGGPGLAAFNISKKRCVELASHAFAYFAKVDESIAEDLKSALDGFDKRVLVVGAGGREHAIVRTLSQSEKVSQIFVAPGNFGTGVESEKCCNVNISADDIAALVAFAQQQQVDLVVVGPEQPLVLGLADQLRAANIACFGPSARAAVIEASKAWTKDFMLRNNIRTARYRNFTDFEEAKAYILSADHRVVVKASGIAAGKGVILPSSKEEAVEAARDMLESHTFGDAGSEIVIEEFLEGEEVSVLAFCDGITAKGMPAAQDHKRIFDNDNGPNTGGMGAYAPTPCLTPAQYRACMEVIQQTVSALAKEGLSFVGVLYGGFILTKQGPSVLEFNCRFGDPETQALLPLLRSDLFDVLQACVENRLEEEEVAWREDFCCAVVCAAPGYPEAYPKGSLITGLETAALVSHTKVFHAGTAPMNGQPVTSGGRVLAVSGMGGSLQEAVQRAYEAVKCIHFDGVHYRKDIAAKGLRRKVRLGVLGSTRGTSLQPVLDAIAAGRLHAEITLVVSNKASSGILERARAHQVPALHISAVGHSREEYDALVIQALRDAGVDLVLMIGYMRIVSSVFVQAFPERCLNVHPSLLPDFAGGMDLDVHQAVLAAGRTKSGCTLHFVTEAVDGGPIVLQKECAITAEETADSLKGKVQALEGDAFIEAIELFSRGQLKTYSVTQREILTYRDAGVDIDAGEALVEAIKPFCKATRRTGCDAELGGFGGLFDLAQAGFLSSDTVLVSGTDGVGTKLKIAQTVGKHDTIGIDLVAMCVNDILVCGAEPLFFLDYYATGALQVTEAAQVVKGIAEGCLQSGCALIGGETAEMAGMYSKGEYDLAGFAVGAVRRPDILPRGIQAGDVLLGLPSSGVHSNGYSLVRKCVERSGLTWSAAAPFQPSLSLAEALLVPTRIYVKALMPLIKKKVVKGMAHITGGGLLDNLPRILPESLAALVDVKQSGWQLPPVFQWLQSIANLPQQELLRTFNCGIGMVVVVGREDVEEVIADLEQDCGPVLRLGELIAKPVNSEAVIVEGELA
eukprot:gene9328-10298_t